MCFKTRKSDFRPKIRGSAPTSSTLKQFLIFKKLTRNKNTATCHRQLTRFRDRENNFARLTIIQGAIRHLC